MKKRKHVIVLVGLSILASLSSCETVSHNTSTFRRAETKNVYISVPMVVEYDTVLSQRVVDTSTFSANSGDGGVVDYEALKQWAIIYCSKKYDCDVLVNPNYIVTNKSGIVTIVVSGMPARYKRIRQATEKDLWMLRFFDSFD